jgi:hypothetical protein
VRGARGSADPFSGLFKDASRIVCLSSLLDLSAERTEHPPTESTASHPRQISQISRVC